MQFCSAQGAQASVLHAMAFAVRGALAVALTVLVILHSALAEPPTPQQTLAKPALLTADSAALTGPFGPGGVLGFSNKTAQVAEATLFPLAAYIMELGQLFYGMEPVRTLYAEQDWCSNPLRDPGAVS